MGRSGATYGDFAAAYPDPEFVQQAAAKLLWGRHIVLRAVAPTQDSAVWTGREQDNGPKPDREHEDREAPEPDAIAQA